MKPESRSKNLLGITQSKAKMYEYFVPENHHIDIPRDPSRLFFLSIGIIGDYSSKMWRYDVADYDPNLLFAAQYFESYTKTKLNTKDNDYIRLLASSCYFLANFPGNAIVLIRDNNINTTNTTAQFLDVFLLRVLKHDLGDTSFGEGEYSSILNSLKEEYLSFFQSGLNRENVFSILAQLRTTVHSSGSARELFLCDILCAIIKLKISRSVWELIPKSTSIPTETWKPIFLKDSFVKELWPSQRILAEKEIFLGKSAVIQMPTSAGKTKSIEILIRSSVLSKRSKVCVVVAPFRALCHEIKDDLTKAFAGENIRINELSEVYQNDFDISGLISLGNPQILILTPEKLVYVLRQEPTLSLSIGLIIFDEGHQFDSGKRGVVFELLLSSLKDLLRTDCQKIIISAVISNADAIGSWFNGDTGIVITGENLQSTYRTLGFTSWHDVVGRIEFVQQPNIDESLYFVPRIIESKKLQKKKKERKEIIFPSKNDGASVALYLGLKLIANGGVAIFCGQKATAHKMAEQLIDLYERNYDFLPQPIVHSDNDEINRLFNLYKINLGDKSTLTRACKYGILSHHALVPQSLRLSSEYALRNGLAKYVICTSTLAQGVNLPIRYLIFTSFYQAGSVLKVRDFHNLIGRAGRTGFFTEGSILIADPEIFDRRHSFKEKWRWAQMKKLIDPSNSEKLSSTLLEIFKPIENEKGDLSIKLDVMMFADFYYKNAGSIDENIDHIVSEHNSHGFKKQIVKSQFDFKISILASIESHILMNSYNVILPDENNTIDKLAKNTLAYHLANESEKKELIKLFSLISENVGNIKVKDEAKPILGKTLLGIHDLEKIDKFVFDNIEAIKQQKSVKDLFIALWPLIIELMSSSSLYKLTIHECRLQLCLSWISGKSYFQIFSELMISNCRWQYGSKTRELKIEHIVEICEGDLSFESMIVIGAIFEVYQSYTSDLTLKTVFKALQKSLKYGLEDNTEIALYEMGFCDRHISQELASIFTPNNSDSQLLKLLKDKKDMISKTINQYPRYFHSVLDNIFNIK